VYALADGNAVVARRLRQESFSGRICPNRETFVSIHCRLCYYGNFTPRVANKRRPRSMTPELEKDILDVVNEIPGIRT
jgi:hypothetical protein